MMSAGGAGACAMSPAIGEACTVPCVRGAYCYTTATPPVCAQQLGVGAACTSPLACVSNTCDGGVCAASSGGPACG